MIRLVESGHLVRLVAEGGYGYIQNVAGETSLRL